MHFSSVKVRQTRKTPSNSQVLTTRFTQYSIYNNKPLYLIKNNLVMSVNGKGGSNKEHFKSKLPPLEQKSEEEFLLSIIIMFPLESLSQHHRKKKMEYMNEWTKNDHFNISTTWKREAKRRHFSWLYSLYGRMYQRK